MESALNREYTMLVTELTQGLEKAKQLRLLLRSTSPSEAQDFLLQNIVSSYEKALMILKWRGSVDQAQPGTLATLGLQESSISVDGSSRSEDLNKSSRNQQDYTTSKKRKLQPSWTEQVRVNSEAGLEGPINDGYSWRKYGQKDILGAKHPRSYYRCTYRAVQNCWATKQVQRSDEDPTIFEITYKGSHTCNQSSNTVPPPAPPEKQELKQEHSIKHQEYQQNSTLLDFKANLRVNTENLDNKEIPAQFYFPSTYGCQDSAIHDFPVSALFEDNHLSAYSPRFLSPATSESNYFSPATYRMHNYGQTQNCQHSESDVAGIVSGHASTANSPICGMEFALDLVELDPNFPFNNPGFFT